MQGSMAIAAQRPTPTMRVISYVGTAAFIGFFWYMLYQGTRQPMQPRHAKKEELTRQF